MTAQLGGARRPQVAAYWFGNWHIDPRMERWFGAGWTEWELVRAGTPRFPGHHQPLLPSWGFTDDTNPVHMARACAAAFDAGIDAFLVDWYWYDGPFLNRPLDQVLLGLETPLSFALMWANHDWQDVFPAPHGVPLKLLAPAVVDSVGFSQVTQIVIDRYMSSSRYWRVDGAAYFSIFEIDNLVDWLGGINAARSAFDDFRARAAAAGIGKLHLAAITTKFTPNGEGHRNLEALGIDSINHYNWSSQFGSDPIVPYRSWRQSAEREWDTAAATYPVPSAPNVSVGWDCTPRTPPSEPVRVEVWPYQPVVIDNNPQELELAVRHALEWLAARSEPSYLTINAWNEWTEGSVLEPNDQWGSAQLKAVKRALASRSESRLRVTR
ncbi:MAG: glycoside hydrolase family 99-like domain-containing protein [Candidatus Dormibacteraceae bacterium]